MNAEDVKAIRLKLGITQDEMARRLKCTMQTVSRMELAKSRPTKAMIRKLNRQALKIKGE